MHGRSPRRLFLRDVYSILFWGLLLPVAIVALALATHGLGLLLALVYPLQMLRIAGRHYRAGMAARDAWLYGWSCMLGKVASAIGLVRFWTERLRGRNRIERVITYK